MPPPLRQAAVLPRSLATETANRTRAYGNHTHRSAPRVLAARAAASRSAPGGTRRYSGFEDCLCVHALGAKDVLGQGLPHLLLGAGGERRQDGFVLGK